MTEIERTELLVIGAGPTASPPPPTRGARV